MKITRVRSYGFRLPLVRSWRVDEPAQQFREGIVVQIIDDDNSCGWGEISPLPGFSRETIADVRSRLTALTVWLKDQTVPDGCEQLVGVFDEWLRELNLPASLRFGLESAILDMIATSRQQSLSVLLGATEVNSVPLNALLTGSPSEIVEQTTEAIDKNYQAIKIKIGRRSVRDEISLIREVARIIGERASIRLDANRSWDYQTAISFARNIDGCRIEYIEEPCGTFAESREFAGIGLLPTALDESLLNLSPEQLKRHPEFAALILKPTLLGGLERAATFAREALGMGMTPIMSSSIESSLGILTLAHLANAVGQKNCPVGLDTLSFFGDDLLRQPLEIHRGRLILPDSSVSAEPDTTRLQELIDVRSE